MKLEKIAALALILIIGIFIGYLIPKENQNIKSNNLPVNYMTNKNEKEEKIVPISVEVRKNDKPPIEYGLGMVENSDIWIKYSNGKEELLVASKLGNTPEDTVVGINNAFLSIDKTKIYYMSLGGVTSAAIHIFDIKSKKELTNFPGNSLKVIDKGQYTGKLIVNRHKYNDTPNYGSYDHYYIMDESGKEIKDIGEKIIDY